MRPDYSTDVTWCYPKSGTAATEGDCLCFKVFQVGEMSKIDQVILHSFLWYGRRRVLGPLNMGIAPDTGADMSWAYYVVYWAVHETCRKIQVEIGQVWTLCIYLYLFIYSMIIQMHRYLPTARTAKKQIWKNPFAGAGVICFEGTASFPSHIVTILVNNGSCLGCVSIIVPPHFA